MSSDAVTCDKDRWGWVMVAVMFLESFIVTGQLKALGVLLIPMTYDLDSELWLMGWIAVLYNMIQNCWAPMVGALSRLLGARPMILVGGVMCTVGVILASFAPSVSVLAVCVILLSGLGSSFIWYIGFAVMACYFKEKYPLAIGLATMGIPIGIMAYGPVTQVLLDTYGWRGAMLLLEGVSFHLVACAMLVRHDPSASSASVSDYQELSVHDEGTAQEQRDPVANLSSHTTRSATGDKTRWQRIVEAIDFKVLADPRIALLVLGRSLISFNFSAWVVFMVPHGKFQGLGDTQASFLPTAFGIGNVLGKALAPLLQLLGKKLHMTFWACFGAALICVSFALDAFITSFAGLMAVTGLLGVGYAALYQAVDVRLQFLAEDERLVSIQAWQGACVGVASALGGLVSGWIYEWTGSFVICCFLYAGMTLLSIPPFIMEAVQAKRTHNTARLRD